MRREKPTVGCAGQCLRFCQRRVLETGLLSDLLLLQSSHQEGGRKWLLGLDPPRWTPGSWPAGIDVLGENSPVYVECDNHYMLLLKLGD